MYPKFQLPELPEDPKKEHVLITGIITIGFIATAAISAISAVVDILENRRPSRMKTRKGE